MPKENTKSIGSAIKWYNSGLCVKLQSVVNECKGQPALCIVTLAQEQWVIFCEPYEVFNQCTKQSPVWSLVWENRPAHYPTFNSIKHLWDELNWRQ